VPGVDAELARQLIETAHRTCPYSKAIKGNIDAVVALV
jgi:lipoyl-dependent peroxiredoxin